ncbi:hypothetical protein [Thiolapillus sp.]
MIDKGVERILELSDPPVGEPPQTEAIEREFAYLSGGCFTNPPLQPYHLKNYGFGLKNGINAVIPFCVSKHAVEPNLARYPEIAPLIQAIKNHIPDTPYPILAGSAVFLGARHGKCNDVDLVAYVLVGTTDEERHTVGRTLRDMVSATAPTEIKATVSGGKRLFAEGVLIEPLLDQLVGNNPQNPAPDLVCGLASVQLIFDADPTSLNKQITLQIHFIHQSFIETDIHPYQELPECNANNFFHKNQHWLAPSFLHYFRFLLRGIEAEPMRKNPLKAAKRAAMLTGMAGLWKEQDLLIAHINGRAPLADVDLQALINRLRAEISPLVTAGII